MLGDNVHRTFIVKNNFFFFFFFLVLLEFVRNTRSLEPKWTVFIFHLSPGTYTEIFCRFDRPDSRLSSQDLSYSGTTCGFRCTGSRLRRGRSGRHPLERTPGTGVPTTPREAVASRTRRPVSTVDPQGVRSPPPEPERVDRDTSRLVPGPRYGGHVVRSAPEVA